MSCRAGITTRPEERRSEWKRRYYGFRRWRVWGPYSDRAKAQRLEAAMAREIQCVAYQGGRWPEKKSGPWYLYYFEYSSIR